MSLAIAAAFLLLQNPASDFQPTGPKIRFTMQSGKSFVITTDQAGSPITVGNILKLVRKKFYDGI